MNVCGSRLVAGFALAAVTLVSGCGDSKSRSRALGEVDTAIGTYRITKAAHGNRYPFNCSSDCMIGPATTDPAQTIGKGKQVVAVDVESQFDEKNAEHALGQLCKGSTYLRSDGGTTANCWGADLTSRLDTNEPYSRSLLFIPKAGATGFTLHVRHNDPVQLGF